MARRIMNWFLDTDWFRDERVLSDKESLFFSVTKEFEKSILGVTGDAHVQHSCSTVYDVGPTLNQQWPMYGSSSSYYMCYPYISMVLAK